MIARTSTGLIFAVVFLFGLFAQYVWAPYVVLGIILFACWKGTHEYYVLSREKEFRPSFWPGHGIALAFIMDAWFFGLSHFTEIFLVCFWALLLTQVFFKKHEFSIGNMAVSLFGSIYVGLPMALFLVLFREPDRWHFLHPRAGGYLVVFFLLTSWATDIGGYCVGKPLGRHKMCPVLSPKKSVEGMAGGVLFALLAGISLKLFCPPLGDFFNWWEVLGLPMAFSLFGTVGDLAESAFKRDAVKKDSGRTFTGHGGMLDIVDSMLLCVPVFYIYLQWVKL